MILAATARRKHEKFGSPMRLRRSAYRFVAEVRIVFVAEVRIVLPSRCVSFCRRGAYRFADEVRIVLLSRCVSYPDEVLILYYILFYFYIVCATDMCFLSFGNNSCRFIISPE